MQGTLNLMSYLENALKDFVCVEQHQYNWWNVDCNIIESNTHIYIQESKRCFFQINKHEPRHFLQIRGSLASIRIKQRRNSFFHNYSDNKSKTRKQMPPCKKVHQPFYRSTKLTKLAEY